MAFLGMNSVSVNIPMYRKGFLGSAWLLWDCLVAGHLGKGLLELLRDSLQLLLLGCQLILQPVHLLLKLLHGLLSKLSPSLSLLQLGLLLGDLQGLQVVCHNPQLLLQLDNLDLTNLCPLLSPLQVSLSLHKLLLHLVILLVCILGLGSDSLQLLFELAHPLLVLVGPALQHLPHPVAAVAALSNFWEASSSLSSQVSRSPSRHCTLMFKTFTSSSADDKEFSFSFSFSVVVISSSIVLSSSTSSC